jgi:hypothetical protein
LAHPLTGERIERESALPEDLRTALERAGREARPAFSDGPGRSP